ncbi:MAG: hypothetical protein GY811_24175 [Myxococcales bacterium]|nr:hypothetical protein [Myxococcales bacterium]
MKNLRATLLALLIGTLGALALPGHVYAQDGEGDEASIRRPPAKSKSMKSMKALFKILKGEPRIKDVQRWALRHYKLSPHRVNGMATNARLKGLVPEVSFNFSNNKGNTFGNMRDGLYPTLPNIGANPNPDSLKERTAGTSSTNVFSVHASWSLDRLVFNPEGLDVKSLNSLGETLVREVATLYFSRRRLLASIILSPPEDPEELFFELTRLDEMTATIDSLTGNRFGKRSWKWSESMLGL